MNITFDEYIANPMGRKNSVFTHREMYREMYTKKLDEIMVRENGSVDFVLYTDENNIYYVHIKIPSEVVSNFYYDVVLKFYTNNNTISSSRSIKDYYVEFFSNDPSFMFTFAHAFLKNKLFIKDLVPKMSKQAVKKVAVDKNPSDEVGYVKSIYFAYLIMKRYGLFNKVKYEAYSKKYNKKELLNNIIHSEVKLEERNIEGEKQKKKNKKEKAKTEKNNTSNMKSTRINIGNSASTKMIGKIKKTEKSKSTKNVNIIKRVKKI